MNEEPKLFTVFFWRQPECAFGGIPSARICAFPVRINGYGRICGRTMVFTAAKLTSGNLPVKFSMEKILFKYRRFTLLQYEVPCTYSLSICRTGCP